MTLYKRPDIAVIGMAGRFPGAADINTLSTHLERGSNLISEFTKAELLASGVPETLINDPQYKAFCGYLPDAAYFDNALFGISRRDAKLMDPQHRIFLESAWLALKNAGYVSDPAGIVGVFAGASDSEYLYQNLLSNNNVRAECSPFELEIYNSKDQLAPRVSYHLNLRGPSITIQTACSTSLVAIHMACQSIATGECSMALAGGVSLPFIEKRGYHYKPGMNLSADGRIRAFDENASGMVSGFGCGVVVLKALAQAIADGDRIDAVIMSSAVSNDGRNKSGYTAPGVQGQMDAITQAVRAADVCVDDIHFVEAHGSGTLLGDPIEISALKKAFSKTSSKHQYCAVSSIKSNIGHLDVAAGVAGFIKAVLQLKYGKLFPACGFTQPNKFIAFESSPFYVPTELVHLNASRPRFGAVNSLGIGGTNSFALLRSAPEQDHAKFDDKPYEDYPFKRDYFYIAAAQNTTPTHEASTFATSLKAYWQNVLEIEDVDSDRSFFDLGGHSIAALSLIDKLNKAFSLNLPSSWVQQFPTLIAQQVALDKLTSKTYSPVIRFNEPQDESRATLIFIHASVSGAEVYRELATYLERDVNFWSIDSINLNGNIKFIESLNDLVDTYVTSLLAEDLPKTFYLGGWSLGGILALEISKRLQEKGYQIPTVFMLDSIYYSKESALFFESDNYIYFRPSLKHSLDYQELSTEYKSKLQHLNQIETDMVKGYVLSGYEGKLKLYIAKEPLVSLGTENESITAAFQALKQRNGWPLDDDKLQIQMLDANHQNIITGNRVAQVAADMLDCI